MEVRVARDERDAEFEREREREETGRIREGRNEWRREEDRSKLEKGGKRVAREGKRERSRSGTVGA